MSDHCCFTPSFVWSVLSTDHSMLTMTKSKPKQCSFPPKVNMPGTMIPDHVSEDLGFHFMTGVVSGNSDVHTPSVTVTAAGDGKD